MNYHDLMEKVGRGHNYIGWYHSHPGFGCWLSGIDCNTQKLFQRTNKIWFALVVDPYRTKSKKKIDLGCFIMYNDEKGNRKVQEFDSIPLAKAEEFGVHQKKYYRMPHEFFQSKFEGEMIKMMYKDYWVDSLYANALLTNDEFFRENIDDLQSKMKAYNIKKKAEEVNDKVTNEIHQKKINDVIQINSQVNASLQNEIIKGIIFK